MKYMEAITQKKHGELENGDRVWNCGNLFLVSNLVKQDFRDGKGEVVRYTGTILKGNLKGTGFDGGRYGAYSWVPVTVAA